MHADSIPVYVGAATPLQRTKPFPREWIDAAEKGGAEYAPPTPRRPRDEGAARYLAGVLRASAPRPDILALGPLTNLAQAIRLAGAGAVQPIRTVVMGGALDVAGNLPAPEFRTTNTKAEWNIYADPIAAREVASSPLRMQLIALDATRHVEIDTCLIRAFRRGRPTPQRAYVGRIMEGARTWIERGGYYAWDPLAAVALVDPGVVRYSATPVTVELTAPYEGWVHRAKDGFTVSIATDADRERFAKGFAAALGPAPEVGGRPYFCVAG
jgi:pyrimidine-specific ribonucleoside hydrolase